jgi:hypothetical protein
MQQQFVGIPCILIVYVVHILISSQHSKFHGPWYVLGDVVVGRGFEPQLDLELFSAKNLNI